MANAEHSDTFILKQHKEEVTLINCYCVVQLYWEFYV